MLKNIGTKEEVIIKNMDLVKNIAKRYHEITGVEEEDLISCGYEALVRAVNNRENDSITVSISKYINGYIHCYIRYFIERECDIKKGTLYQSFMTEKKMVEEIYGCQLEENFNMIDDIVSLLVEEGKIKKEDANRVGEKIRKQYGEKLISLDQIVEEEEESTFGLIDDHFLPYQIAFLLTKNLLEQKLELFTEKQKDILFSYYGVDCDRPFSLLELSEKYQCSGENIRHIRNTVQQKLKGKALEESFEALEEYCYKDVPMKKVKKL